jgi:tripartite-type tricarboxylate transporter receptor subunit TctC
MSLFGVLKLFRYPIYLFLWLFLGIGAGITSSRAQTLGDFYKNTPIKMIIRSEAGGTYDVYSRILSRHINRFIPGQPTMININMPGGGGIIAANYVGMTAPRDGSIMSMIGLGLPVDQALGLNKSLRIDLRELNWIGSISSSNQVLVSWRTSKVGSLEKAKEIESQIGSTGAGSVSQQYPAFYNAFLKTKFKVIYGYAGTNQLNLAMERGEIDGSGSTSWAQYVMEAPRLVREKMIVPIIQVGLKKEPDLQHVPLLLDLAKTDEEKAAFRFLSNSVNFGRPMATTPQVPAERLVALREAFAKTMVDEAFSEDVKRSGGEVRWMPADELTQLVTELTATSEPLKARLRTVFGQ